MAGALFVSCASPQVALQRYEFQRAEMGVPFRIVLYASDEVAATNAANAAFTRIQELNDVMSDYEYDSELSRLSRTSVSGQAVKVGDDLWKVLLRAQEISKLSEGAFDVTVGPVVQLWRKARRDKKFPEAQKLEAARAAVGYKKMRLDAKAQTVELLAKNMRLDLGGIAKGYAVDEATRVLRTHGIRSSLVSGGGDMFAQGAPPGKKGWKIELSSIDETNAAKEFVLLRDVALATSGDTFQFVELDGKRYSHIVDPRTGIGLTDHSLVNLIAKDCMTADAMSKLISVLPPRDSLPIIERSPFLAARILRKPSGAVERYESRKFRNFLMRN